MANTERKEVEAEEEMRTPAEGADGAFNFGDDASDDGVMVPPDNEGDNSDEKKERETEQEVTAVPDVEAEVEAEEPTAWVLVASARKTLNKCNGGIDHVKTALRKKIHLLDEKHVQEVQAGGFEDIILEGWVEELLRFLALKTLMDDATKPFQLAPGGAISIAWKELMVMPSNYAAVCYAMGNANVIDHDPFDATLTPEEVRHMQKRLNATMRNYAKYFDEQPPALFWKDVQEPMEPSPLVQIYRTAQQMWQGVANCGSDAVETVSGCTSTKQGGDVPDVDNDLVEESSVHATMMTAE